jgi:hypothetical protein
VTRIRAAAFLLFALPLIAATPAAAQWRPIYPGYPSYRYAAPEADLRFKVKPKEAAVYVDGYFAGIVDDFDGAFERLHVTPGQHDIVVYLRGHRSLRQQLYLAVNRTRTIEGVLEPLTADAPNEPLPTPAEDPDDVDDPGPVPRRPLLPQDRPERRPAPARELPPSTAAASTLSIRVQPGGTTVLIDGERWQGPADNDERLIVQVADGRHRIEVTRDGYEPFVTEITTGRGETVLVNVSLRRR